MQQAPQETGTDGRAPRGQDRFLEEATWVTGHVLRGRHPGDGTGSFRGGHPGDRTHSEVNTQVRGHVWRGGHPGDGTDSVRGEHPGDGTRSEGRTVLMASEHQGEEEELSEDADRARTPIYFYLMPRKSRPWSATRS